MRYANVCLIAVFLSAHSYAQTSGTYLLLSSNVVSPTSPTTTIEVWAAWDDPSVEFIFTDGDYDLAAGDGEFIGAVNVLNGPGSTTGSISRNVVSGARNGQLIIPSLPPPRPINPVLLVVYEWTTTDFHPRFIDLSTRNTSVFELGDYRYPAPNVYVQLFPGEFTAGHGFIEVVPASSTMAVLAGALITCRRRRE